MRVLLSPAKKMDFSGISREVPHTVPQLANDIDILIQHLRLLSTADIRKIMRLSDGLTDLTYARFQFLGSPVRGKTAEPAALAFAGDTYIGFQARSLSLDDLQWAQQHIRILSGLYGVLRPLDLIEPHRLEMGTKLETERGKDLYAFWKEHLSPLLENEANTNGESFIINLASTEYFKVLQNEPLAERVITPVFLEEKDGHARSLGLMSKRARGMMARYIVRHRLLCPDDLRSFRDGGYRFSSERSDAHTFVFTRPQPASRKEIQKAGTKKALQENSYL